MYPYQQLLEAAIRWQSPAELPVAVSILPRVWLEHADAACALVAEFPDLLGQYRGITRFEEHPLQASYRAGSWTDEWGCVWTNVAGGLEGYVTGHPLQTAEDCRRVKMPSNRDGRIPHGFLYLRVLDLLGFETAMELFVEEPDAIAALIGTIVEHTLLQIDVAAPRSGPVFYLGDDLGMQHGLALGAVRWRQFFAAAYARIFARVHAHGRLVYFHSDGRIVDILDDLKAAGADMINPQFRANGLADLVRVCRGRIPIHLDLDRQLLPVARPGEVARHVEEATAALYLPEGGLGLSLELGPGIRPEIMHEAVAAVEQARSYRGTP